MIYFIQLCLSFVSAILRTSSILMKLSRRVEENMQTHTEKARMILPGNRTRTSEQVIKHRCVSSTLLNLIWFMMLKIHRLSFVLINWVTSRRNITRNIWNNWSFIVYKEIKTRREHEPYRNQTWNTEDLRPTHTQNYTHLQSILTHRNAHEWLHPHLHTHSPKRSF